MKSSTRQNACVLLGTFIVMMISLAYYPVHFNENSGETAPVVIITHVSGAVTDEFGIPIANAFVNFYGIGQSGVLAITDENGHYSANLNSSCFYSSEIVECTATGYYRWCHQRSFVLDAMNPETGVDFTLIKSKNMTFPVGPVVLASTSPGLTRVNISTYLEDAVRCCYSINGTGYWATSPRSLSYSRTSDNGSLSLQAVCGRIWGQYSDISNGICMNATCWLDLYNANSETLSEEELVLDYLDPQDVESRSAFYSLDYNESVRITATPDRNVTLPEALMPIVTCEVPGSILTPAIRCTYIDHYDYWLGGCSIDSSTYASVTITPLTSGIHVYQAYIEDGYIIHVWELPDDES